MSTMSNISAHNNVINSGGITDGVSGGFANLVKEVHANQPH